MRIGTSYFISAAHAARYYFDALPWMGPHDARCEVERKLRAGEIHIGKPELKPGERLCLIDNARYAIEDDI